MNRWSLVLAGCVLGLTSPQAFAQETATVQVTLKIAKTTPSFKDLRLVVMLYHDHPLQDDRGLTTVDRYVDAKFAHQQGKDTVLTITVGAKAKLRKDVPYSVNVTVFDKASKLTHFSERDQGRGPFDVLNGAPSKITVLVRPAQP
jgi:hypothetical protein